MAERPLLFPRPRPRPRRPSRPRWIDGGRDVQTGERTNGRTRTAISKPERKRLETARCQWSAAARSLARSPAIFPARQPPSPPPFESRLVICMRLSPATRTRRPQRRRRERRLRRGRPPSALSPDESTFPPAAAPSSGCTKGYVCFSRFVQVQSVFPCIARSICMLSDSIYCFHVHALGDVARV